MIKRPYCAAVLLLAACSGSEEEARQPDQAAANRAAIQAGSPPSPAAAPAKARAVEEKSDFLEFTYSWPAEASAVPKLVTRFEAELAQQRKEAMDGAREDKEARGPEVPYNGHYFSKVWSTLGQTPRLLSLAAEIGTFTGGAHGNSGYDALLWDRKADAPVELAGIFSNPAAAFNAMTPVYCKELDRQRAEKRQGEMGPPGDWMTECRALAEQVVAPVDENKDSRFELFRVLIEPYNAGPYAEGTYEVDIPVTEAVRKLVKPEYAGAF
jgi:hypothetical protein